MTEESPKRTKPSDVVFCDECHCAVRLERADDATLRARCGCGDERQITLLATTPAGWSA